MKDTRPARVRLGIFELDLRSGELCADGSKTVLREQPLQIVRMLIEREGELVSREEIRKTLWPNDTIVEFDHSINSAIKNLRRALGDSAETPTYIETLARRGYRLMVAVEPLSEGDSPAEVQAGAGTPVRLEPKTDLIGKKVSHYRVLQVIGAGGMGLAYKAEDLKLGRQVALKFLPEELAGDPAALQRFEREAQTASSLNHPNICTIHEVEEHDGKPFIVMELLEGKTLRDRLTALASLNKALPVDEVLDIAVQICSGLEAAHAKGIIHRDIKPANLFITSGGQAKILDFGIAKATATASGETAAELLSPDAAYLTTPGAMLGTVAYMSPEQVKAQELGARSDLFSFGAVVYEMATGKLPFNGSSAGEICGAILHDEPPPASEINPEISPGLQTIIGKALEKDRNLRYQHASDMRTDLQRLKRDTDSKALAVAWQQESESEAPKRSAKAWLAFAAAALLFAVLAGGLYWRYSRARASQAPSKLTSKDPIVLADFSNSTGDPVFDGTLHQALAIQLEQSPFLNVLSDKQVGDTLKLMNRQPNEKLTSDIAREVCLRSNSKAFLKGSIAAIGEQFLITEQAINCQTGETVASAESQAQNRNGVLQALQDVGNQLRQKLGESLSSIATLNQPLEKVTTSSLEALQAYALGDRAVRGNSPRDCVPYFQQAIALDPNFALAYLELGLWNSGRNPSLAHSNLTKAYELRDRVSQRERLRIEGVYYGVVLGDWEKEIVAFRQIVQIYPDDWWAHFTLGYVYYELGEQDRALPPLEQARQLHTGDPYTLAKLGRTYVALNRYEEAKTAFEQEEALTPDSDLVRWDFWMLAFAQGDQVTMREQVARAVGKPNEDDLLRWQSCAEAYHGRFAKSRELLQRAIDMAQQAKQFDLAAGWRADAGARDMELGNDAEALREATEALKMGASKDVRLAAALIFTRIGDPVKGHELAETLNREFPDDTLVQHYYLPTITAASEMRKGNPQKAIEVLDPASRYEKCDCSWWVPNYYVAYLRGLAYLDLGQGPNAAPEFQKIVSHPGIALSDITGALARLQLGRAYVMAGDHAKAKAAYEDFLTLWKDADPDIPIYKQAKAEYAKLQ